MNPNRRDAGALLPSPASFLADLAWTLRSPPLLAIPECAPPLSAAQVQEILDSTRAPEPKAHRLGRYFEQLVEQGVRLTSAGQVFRNVVLKRGRETLGELDLVFVDPKHPQTSQHWEIAIKFYLCTRAESPQLSDYLGPQGRDRLDLKLQKLLTQQLPLGQSDAARAWLLSQGLPTSIQSRLFVKGRLFYPAEADWRHIAAPLEIAPDHLRGWWSRAQIPPHFEASSRWVLLSKLDWISGREAMESVAPLTREALNERLAASALPASVIEVAAQGEGWLEKSRGMIVPEAH